MAVRVGRIRILIAAAGLFLVASIAVWQLRDGDPSGRGRRAVGPARPSIFAAEPGEGPGEGRASLEGTVKDGDGRPIEGATLVLSRPREGEAFGPLRPAATTNSRGGSYRFVNLTPGDYALTAMATGFAPAQRSPLALEASAQRRIDLVLGKGGVVLSGRVLDAGGGPVPGAAVRASGLTRSPVPLLFQAQSDDAGTFRLTLTAGNFSLRAEAEGYAPALDHVTLVHDTTRDLRLIPAARLLGRVVERQTREPVADAEVWLLPERYFGSPPARDVKTDGAGLFAFNDIDPGSYAAAARKGALVGHAKTVAVAAAQTITEIEVLVHPGLQVSGRVSAAGKGVAQARVSLVKREPPFDRAATVRSQADGRYQIEGVLPGRYRLLADAEGLGIWAWPHRTGDVCCFALFL